MQTMIKLYKGDCLIESDKIESGSVDLILTDLPYGTMEGQSDSGIYHQGKEKHEWDNIIPTDKIMEIANRILRKNGKMILFAQEPFTNKLMNSAIPNLPFNYRAIWLKDTLGSFMRSKKALLYKTEDILIYSKNNEFEGLHPLRPYFKQVFEFIGGTKKYIIDVVGQRSDHVFRFKSSQFDLCTLETYNDIIKYFKIKEMQDFKDFDYLEEIHNNYKNEFSSTFNLKEGDKYKSNVFEFKRDRNNYHPTQKPVLLLEDLIKTFSNENDLVVDLTMGSGSTGVAAKNLNRNFIGIEMDSAYFNIACERISPVKKQ
ncbi:MAG: site-specific DNA-methyltransferase (adenine-specific) [Polaribacter sp.]|jgi:site-specific DNA-methyltransferase (adenine-specific)